MSKTSKDNDDDVEPGKGRPNEQEEMATIANASVALDHTGIAIADNNGFTLWQLNPLVLRMHENKVPKVGPTRIVKHLGASHIVAYVSGNGGKYSPNVCMLFSVNTNEDKTEITTPPQYGPITNIHISDLRLAIFQESRLQVFEGTPLLKKKNMKEIWAEKIRPNPTGISAMSFDPTTSSCYLAYPGCKVGAVQILNLNALTSRESRPPVVIEAHLTEVTQVALNCQGTLVATGSMKGTVIRVFDARNKGLLYDLRRGTVQAHLQCLAFSPCSSFLAVASDKNTLHLFAIRDADPQKKMGVVERNRGCSSIAKIPLNRQVLALGFSKQTAKSLQSLVAICTDSSYWRFEFSKDSSGKVSHKQVFYEELNHLADDLIFFRDY